MKGKKVACIKGKTVFSVLGVELPILLAAIGIQ
jgi:hypothetical protein